MKKLFALAAVVALALTSCVTTTEIPDPAGEISFEAYNFKPQSRAEVYGPISGSTYPVDEHFGVYALFNENGHDTYMNDVEIHLDTTDNNWRNPDAKYYWPKGGTLRFWCYSPYRFTTDNSVHTTPTAYDYEKGLTFNGFTTNNNLTTQIDLMVTNALGDSRPAAVEAVFHHTLAQVGFTARLNTSATNLGEEVTITIDKVQMSNVKSTGDYSSTDGTYANGAWTNVNGNVITFDFVTEGKPQTVTTASQPILPLTGEEGNYTLVEGVKNALVIPQDGTKSGDADVDYVKVLIDYTTTYKSGAVDKVQGVEYIIPAAWEKGKKYTYAIIFGVGNEILFHPSVTDWTATEGGSITVG